MGTCFPLSQVFDPYWPAVSALIGPYFVAVSQISPAIPTRPSAWKALALPLNVWIILEAGFVFDKSTIKPVLDYMCAAVQLGPFVHGSSLSDPSLNESTHMQPGALHEISF